MLKARNLVLLTYLAEDLNKFLLEFSHFGKELLKDCGKVYV